MHGLYAVPKETDHSVQTVRYGCCMHAAITNQHQPQFVTAVQTVGTIQMLHACCHKELSEPTYTWANPNDWALGINNAAKDNEGTTEKHALKFLGCLLLSAQLITYMPAYIYVYM